MAIVIDLKTAEDQRDVVHRAVQALAEGEIVAFPTETVYGLAVNALDPAAIEKLQAAKGRDADKPFALAIKGADDALDYVPNISPLGKRLARRCWPGPITLLFDADHPDSVVKQLPVEVQKAIAPTGIVGLRTPAHDVIQEVLRLSAGPLALTSANLSGEPETVTAEDVDAAVGDKVALILDDGRSKFAQPSSVVRVHENSFEILRAGVFNEMTLRRLSGLVVLFVCTGNTCRSPMAEVMLKKRIATALGCTIDEIEDNDVLVASAGIAAMVGGRAAKEAIDAVAERDLDLNSHESQPLTDRLAHYADYILTMTRGHRQAIISQWPEVADRTHILRQDGADVSDPIGGPAELYLSCAEQIDQQLEEWVKRLGLDSLPRCENPES